MAKGRCPADRQSGNSNLEFPFVASDRSLLVSVHELFPPSEQARELLKVYGG